MVMRLDNALKCISRHGKGGQNLPGRKALGYPDDPMKKGTRKKTDLLNLKKVV